MIITDSQPPSPVKSSQGATTIINPSTGSYPGSATQVLLPPPSYGEAYPPFEEPAGRRFVKAFAVAAGIYFLSFVVVGSFYAPKNIHHYLGPTPEPAAAEGSPVACHLPFVPSSGSFRYGVPWLPFSPPLNTTFEQLPVQHGSGALAVFPPYASKSTFFLPGKSPLHFFLARGSLASGIIRFIVAESGGDGSEHTVRGEVITRYYSVQARDRANLCMLKREEGSYGFGILTPTGWPIRQEDMLRFEVTVTFPSQEDLSYATGGLETRFANFAHDIGDLADNLYFKTVDIASSNMAVRAKALHAQAVRIKTSNSGISGFLNVTTTLNLVTSNSPVDVKIHATNEDWHRPTDISIKTSNNLLSANISLATSAEAQSQAIFMDGGLVIKAATSNGRLNVVIPTAPIDSHIQLDAKTSNADAFVGLPPTFEGKVALKNSGWSSSLVLNDVTEDPTGRSLKRTFNKDRNVKGTLEGRVWWGLEKDHRELGLATCVTSNGKNIMELY